MANGSDPAGSVFRNELLAALPAEEMAALRPHLSRMPLVWQQVVHEAGSPIDQVFFLEAGVASVVADLFDKGQVEVGLIGREGLVGIAAVLNPQAIAVHRAFIQVPGLALRMEADVLRHALAELPVFRSHCLRFAQLLLVETAQAAACNARHALPQRLACWLLMLRDRCDSDDVPVTQRFLSCMLGVRRAGVSIASNALEQSGLIQQMRGRVRILDRAALEQQACGCYRLMANARRQIFGPPPEAAAFPTAPGEA